MQNTPVTMTHGRVQEEAAVRVQAIAIQNMKDTSADLARLMESAKVITDPARGYFLDVLM